MNVLIRKLEEAENPLHPNNIEVGFEKIGKFVENPEIGKGFFVGYNWVTSRVTEIISENKFRTLNSIYEWKLIS